MAVHRGVDMGDNYGRNLGKVESDRVLGKSVLENSALDVETLLVRVLVGKQSLKLKKAIDIEQKDFLIWLRGNKKGSFLRLSERLQL